MLRMTKELGLEHRKGQFTATSGPFIGQSNYSYVNQTINNKRERHRRAKSNVLGKKPLDSLMTSPEIKMVAKQSRHNMEYIAYQPKICFYQSKKNQYANK